MNYEPFALSLSKGNDQAQPERELIHHRAGSISPARGSCKKMLSGHAPALAARKVSVEDKRLSLALHYRQCDDPVGTSHWLHELLQSVAQDTAVSAGHMVVNVLSKRAADKGDALLTILQESGAETALVEGDDDNDDAAFLIAQQRALTVRIGLPGECSCARFSLFGQYQMNALLSILVRQKNQTRCAHKQRKYAVLM